MLATVHEITSKIVGQRRGTVLRQLGSAAEARSAETASRNAAAKLAPHGKDIPFALIYLRDETGGACLAAAAGVEPSARIAPSLIAIDDPAALWPLYEAQRTGEMQVVELSARFQPIPRGPWPEPPRQAAVLPIRSHLAHGISGFLVLGLSSHLTFDDDYTDFVKLVAAQITTAISTAQAYEEEHRRANALAEIDRAKTAFFSNVSHEFRTPLTLMLGPLEEMLKEGNLSPGQREKAGVAHRNSLRLLKLVNSLLDFSRIEAGRLQAFYTPVDLSAATRDLASNFRSAMEGGGLELEVDCAPLPEPVYVDPELWEKIVLNLLSNAFKFTHHGRVTVRLQAVGRRAVLTVADTGIGIPPAQLPRIFERFHRVENAQGRSYEGTGIGLAMVQELVGLHGGEIAVESEAGKGSVFIVQLPLGYKHLPQDRVRHSENAPGSLLAEVFVEEALRWLPAGSPELQPIAGARPPAEANARVLLADDNADMRAYVTRLLDGRMRVTAVSNGQEALTAALEDPPDLILTDVMMPGLDGFALLREIRANPKTRAIPVILLSARAGEESRIEGAASGADDYLVKPFSAAELLARVTAHLNLARVRQENLTAMRRLQEISTRLISAGGRESLLQEIMNAAVDLLAADFGTLQLLDGETLRIAAHAGHEQPFLDFFAHAGTRDSVCGEAPKNGRRILVQDVEADPLFSGSSTLPVFRASGVRAVQSTPLFSRDGKMLGVLTTQWRKPHLPDGQDLSRLDLLARQAADLIESSISSELLRASEERLTMAIGAAGLGAWDVDLRTGNARWSGRHFEILGYPAGSDGDATLEMWRARAHPDDGEKIDRTSNAFAPPANVTSPNTGSSEQTMVRFAGSPNSEASFIRMDNPIGSSAFRSISPNASRRREPPICSAPSLTRPMMRSSARISTV